jgi:F-type H+-transporting ATPase subunit b
MPQLDLAFFPSQIFWLIATFALLYVLLANFTLPAIGSVLENREQKIKADIQTAENLRLEAEAARENYEEALKESRLKAQSLIGESANLSEKAAAAQLAESNRAIEKQLAESEAAIDTAKKAALTQLSPLAKDLVKHMSEKLTGYKPSDAEVNAVIETL